MLLLETLLGTSPSTKHVGPSQVHGAATLYLARLWCPALLCQLFSEGVVVAQAMGPTVPAETHAYMS